MGLSSECKLSETISLYTIYDAGGAYDGTTPTMVDMAGYGGCLVLVLGSSVTASATHGVTGFKIVSNTTAAGAGTDHDIAEAVTTDGGSTITLAAADFGTTAPTTLSQQCLYLDIKASQMYAGDRYIGAVIAAAGAFPIVIVYIRYNGDYSAKDLLQSTRTAFQYDGNL